MALEVVISSYLHPQSLSLSVLKREFRSLPLLGKVRLSSGFSLIPISFKLTAANVSYPFIDLM